MSSGTGAISASVRRPFGGYLNRGGGLSRGVELSAQTSPTRSTDLFASYTYINADQRTANAAGYLTVPGSTAHLFTLVATQRIGRRFDVTFDLPAVSDYSPSFPSPSFNTLYIFDGYVKADLVAGTRCRSMTGAACAFTAR